MMMKLLLRKSHPLRLTTSPAQAVPNCPPTLMFAKPTLAGLEEQRLASYLAGFKTAILAYAVVKMYAFAHGAVVADGILLDNSKLCGGFYK